MSRVRSRTWSIWVMASRQATTTSGAKQKLEKWGTSAVALIQARHGH
jgi:hypothetical protein